MKKGTVVNRARCYLVRIPLDCLPGLTLSPYTNPQAHRLASVEPATQASGSNGHSLTSLERRRSERVSA